MIYFASDFHLVPGRTGRSQEARIVEWLERIQSDAQALYLLGDVFDFWFEYRHVVPKGQVRLLGKLAELSDRGIAVHFFPGNHDQWTYGYLEEEVGLQVHKEPYLGPILGELFYLHHGDGIGPGDVAHKWTQRVFRNPFARRAFRWLHPDIGVALARKWSEKSRKAHPYRPFGSLNPESQWEFARQHALQHPVRYYVFGHRHWPLIKHIPDSKAYYINLGDWMRFNTYGKYDGRCFVLLDVKGKIYGTTQ